jgi:hypothetical protein
MEGWSYLSLSGAYKYYSSHQAAYEKFSEKVEEIIRRDINAFVESQESRQEEKEADKG